MRAIVIITCTALSALLAACGGGGGKDFQSTPPPPTSGPPSSPAPPTRPPVPAGALGLAGGPFATNTASFDTITGDWPTTTTGEVRTGTDLVAISYSAADNSYSLTLPALGTGKLVDPLGSGSVSNTGQWLRYEATSFDLVGSDGKLAWVVLRYPAAKELTYTSTGFWYSDATAQRPRREGNFAYGVLTAPGTMPTSGTATYAATVDGRTATNDYISGNATFEFDFGSGSLAGSMRLDGTDGWDRITLGTFTFRDTVYSRGSTLFSGRLSVPTSTETGSFAGQFTGPAGAELMGSFRTPAYHPFFKRWEDVAGIFVGKKK